MKNFMTQFLLIVAFMLSVVMTYAQWQPLTSGTTETLLDIHFLNPSYGAVVGTGGTVLLTDDGGDSWINVGTINQDLGSVRVLGVDTILVAGQNTFDGAVFLTTNGGLDWTLVTDGARLDETSNGVFALAYGGIQSSADQGAQWQDQGLDLGGTLLMEQLSFADDDFGLIAGNVSGFIGYSTYGFFSDDGGNTWLEWYVFDFPNTNAWTHAAFAGPDTVYLFTNQYEHFVPGDTNRVVRMTDFFRETMDGYDVWRFYAEVVNSFLPNYVVDAHFFDGQLGYATSLDGNILKTLDGGATWTSDYLTTDSLRSIYAWSEDLMFAAGSNGQILRLGQVNQTKNASVLDMTLFPNPTTGALTLQGVSEDRGQLLIFNALGELIQTQIWQHETIQMDQLPAGIYQLMLQTSTHRYTGKIVKLD